MNKKKWEKMKKIAMEVGIPHVLISVVLVRNHLKKNTFIFKSNVI